MKIKKKKYIEKARGKIASNENEWDNVTPEAILQMKMCHLPELFPMQVYKNPGNDWIVWTNPDKWSRCLALAEMKMVSLLSSIKIKKT